jgi:hypothetical protein
MCVSFFFFFSSPSGLSGCLLADKDFQIARDCPEGREPVEEVEATWGEIEEGPWGGSGEALPADGSHVMQ